MEQGQGEVGPQPVGPARGAETWPKCVVAIESHAAIERVKNAKTKKKKNASVQLLQLPVGE